MRRCAQCDRSTRGGGTTSSGRRLCRDCYRDLAAFTGAGVSLSSGGGVVDAVVTGLGTRAYAGAYTGEAQASRERRAKLDRTTGFWRRLLVRVVG